MTEEPILRLADPMATTRLAQAIAGASRGGDAIALWGDLGMGKTHFARGFVAALSETPDFVPSPTFSLVQTYPARIAGQPVEIWHFDLYRLEKAAEVYELGWEEALSGGIAIVEWPERLGGLLPKRRLDVILRTGAGPESRSVRLVAGPGWEERLPAILQAWRR